MADANVATQVTDGVKNVFGKVAGNAKNFFSGSSAQVIAIAVIVALLCAVAGYYLFQKLTTNYVNAKSFVINATKEGYILNKSTPIKKFDGFPDLTQNGQRMTVTFWVYIHNLGSGGNYKYVFRRGQTENAVNETTMPLVFFDKDVPNMLHFRIPKKGNANCIGDEANPILGDSTEGLLTNLASARESSSNAKYTVKSEIAGATATWTDDQADTKTWTPSVGRTGITIPYIPIQRWVHVAVVLDETVNGGTITAYVDAEQVAQATNAGTNFRLDTPSNYIYLGSTKPEQSVDGLISYLTFFNYNLNSQDIYADYRKGPIRSLMAKVGLNYGVRPPIYKLDSTTATY